MKKPGAVMLRFLMAFFASLTVVTAVLMTDAVLRHGSSDFLETLAGIALGSVPSAVLTASFVTYFMLNRFFSSRIAGYTITILMAMMALSGAAALLRFTPVQPLNGLASLPAELRTSGEWLLLVSRADWPETGAGLLSFAVFAASGWCVTRFSRTRPLLGAFMAPGSLLLALYLFSVFLSGPADALFSFIGLRVSGLVSTAMLCTASALSMMLFDILLARKPTGGH